MIKKNHLTYLFPITSLFFSFEAFLGTVLGYFLSKIYIEKLTFKFNLPKSLFIPFFQNLRIKIHHWISGILILFFAFLFKVGFLFQPFPLGCVLGVIWHDFQTDREVFKIVFKNDEFN